MLESSSSKLDFVKSSTITNVEQWQVTSKRTVPPSNLEELQEIAKKVAQVSGAENIILFGSVARGTQTQNSDLDLLLLLPTNNRQVLLNAAIEADGVFWNAPYSVDLIPMSLEHYQAGNSVLARRVA
jgi:predicted nucleotidyltransferase